MKKITSILEMETGRSQAQNDHHIIQKNAAKKI